MSGKTGLIFIQGYAQLFEIFNYVFELANTYSFVVMNTVDYRVKFDQKIA